MPILNHLDDHLVLLNPNYSEPVLCSGHNGSGESNTGGSALDGRNRVPMTG